MKCKNPILYLTHRWRHWRDLRYIGYEIRTQNKSFVTFKLILFSLRFNRAYCTYDERSLTLEKSAINCPSSYESSIWCVLVRVSPYRCQPKGFLIANLPTPPPPPILITFFVKCTYGNTKLLQGEDSRAYEFENANPYSFKHERNPTVIFCAKKCFIMI